MKNFAGYEKGINLGGWLSQCGNNYTKEHYDSFIKEEDIKIIASWGLDHVRLPVDYNVVQNEDGTFIDWGFSYIDNCISWCEKYHLNLVLDLHKTQGYVFDNASYCQFFDDESLQQKFINLWLEFTKRYAKYSDRVCFELLNEVTALETAQKWNIIAKRTIAEIRKLSNIKIIIGGVFNSSIFGLTLLDAPHDKDIVFTFHCYSPLIFTHQSAYWLEKMPKDYKLAYPISENLMKAESNKILGPDFDSDFSDNDDNISSQFFETLFKTAIDVSNKFDVPLYCGEYGVIDKADAQSTLNWYRDISKTLRAHNISRSAWTYKQMDFGFIGEHYKDVFEELKQLL